MNLEIAEIFREIAYILEMGVNQKEGEDEKTKLGLIFKIRSYRRAADMIENLYREIDEIYRTEKISGLLKLPSIGKAIALKLEEYITTGKIGYYEDLKKNIQFNVSEFMNLEGIGPKTIMALYKALKIQNISELEKAALDGKIRKIGGFSQKREEIILKRIQFLKKGKERRLIGEIYPLVKEIENRLGSIGGVRNATGAGSFRRMKETVGDVDFLVSVAENHKGNAKAMIIDYFTKMPEVRDVIGKGSAKTFVRLRNGIQADLLVVPEDRLRSGSSVFHRKQRTRSCRTESSSITRS